MKHIIDERDWTEDFHLENGNYYNLCCSCKEMFIGYKRRVVCKKCVTEDKIKFDALTPEQQEEQKLKNIEAIKIFFKKDNI